MTMAPTARPSLWASTLAIKFLASSVAFMVTPASLPLAGKVRTLAPFSVDSFVLSPQRWPPSPRPREEYKIQKPRVNCAGRGGC